MPEVAFVQVCVGVHCIVSILLIATFANERKGKDAPNQPFLRTIVLSWTYSTSRLEGASSLYEIAFSCARKVH